MIFKLVEDFTYPSTFVNSGTTSHKYINPETGKPMTSSELEKHIIDIFNGKSTLYREETLKKVISELQAKIDNLKKRQGASILTDKDREKLRKLEKQAIEQKAKAEKDLDIINTSPSNNLSDEDIATNIIIDMQSDTTTKYLLKQNIGFLKDLLRKYGLKFFKNADLQDFLQYVSELRFAKPIEDKLEFVLNSWRTLKDVVNTHPIFKSRSLYLEAGKDIKDFKYFLNILKVLADDKLKSDYFDLDKELGDGTKASDTINIDNLLDNGSLPAQEEVYGKIDDWTRDFGAAPKEKKGNSKDESKISDFNIVNSIYDILGRDKFNDKIELQGGKIDFNGANIGWLFKLLGNEPFNIVIPENMSDALKTVKPDNDVKKEFLAISADKLDELKAKINTFIKDNYISEEQ